MALIKYPLTFLIYLLIYKLRNKKLKTSNNSCPMYPVNAFPSTKRKKKESKNDNP